MGPKEARSAGEPRAGGHRQADKPPYVAHWPLSGKTTAATVSVIALLAVGVFGLTQRTNTVGNLSSSTLSHPAAPPKPALTRAEEAYIQALWPIHGEVERTTARMSLGKILYKTNDLSKADLKARTDAALSTYRRAEARINALQPPPSLARSHDDYLAAVRLFEQSTLEAQKMFDDGDDEHLVAAYPFSQEGSDKIREIGIRFWQDEYPPN